MLQDNKKNTGKTDFIAFLRQNFFEDNDLLAANSEKKVFSPKKVASSDEDIRAVLRATLPLKNDKLELVLNKHLPAPETDVEERLVGEWRKKTDRSIERVMDGYRGKARARGKPEFIFDKHKTAGNSSAYSWPAKLAVAGLCALFLSFALARFTPKLSRSITTGFDWLIVRPIIVIVRYTSPDLKRGGGVTADQRGAITKDMLTAYIIKNGSNFKYGDIRTIKVKEEDLRGRVAGISEEFNATANNDQELSGDFEKIGFINSVGRIFRKIFN